MADVTFINFLWSLHLHTYNFPLVNVFVCVGVLFFCSIYKHFLICRCSFFAFGENFRFRLRIIKTPVLLTTWKMMLSQNKHIQTYIHILRTLIRNKEDENNLFVLDIKNIHIHLIFNWHSMCHKICVRWWGGMRGYECLERSCLWYQPICHFTHNSWVNNFSFKLRR